MLNRYFLESVMDSGVTNTITICGSARYRELKEKYQAYYTIKNNVVFAPIKYSTIQDEVETDDNFLNIARTMASIHDKKIDLSQAIIVVVGDDCYFGNDTQREIAYAFEKKKFLLFSNVPEEEKEKYYCNDDKNYPLYILKEDYK